MKKSYFRLAAMMAASVLSVSSFVSCDEEEEDNSFKSETFSVELPAPVPYLMIDDCTHSIGWEWVNQSEAAAEAKSFKFVQDSADILGRSRKEVWTFSTKENGVEELKFSFYRLDKSIIPSFNDSIVPSFNDSIIYLPIDTTAYYDGSVSEEFFKDRLLGNHFSNDPASRVVKDTVIYFKR